jgi:hypothetical protein
MFYKDPGWIPGQIGIVDFYRGRKTGKPGGKKNPEARERTKEQLYSSMTPSPRI